MGNGREFICNGIWGVCVYFCAFSAHCSSHGGEHELLRTSIFGVGCVIRA